MIEQVPGLFTSAVILLHMHSSTKFTRRHAVNQISTLWLHTTWQQLLYSCILVPGTASCRTIHGVQSVATQ